MSSQSSLLALKNFHVSVEGKDVVKGIDLKIGNGEIHAIMGPNGSGKSSLVSALMGHPSYEVTKGSVQLQGKNILSLDPSKRAALGLFLAFQYPREIAGVGLRSFLYAAVSALATARGEKKPSPVKFRDLVVRTMQELKMDPSFAERSVNQGFSGGEKKKAEVLQLSLLSPRLALLDETDSGLDIDALKIVADGVNRLRSPSFSALIVTHYARLLEYVKPDKVHVMVRGKIVESGDASLAYTLEREGYARYGVTNEGDIRLENA
jgi:Fe-S cluster assembly ATP-binding protein